MFLIYIAVLKIHLYTSVSHNLFIIIDLHILEKKVVSDINCSIENTFIHICHTAGKQPRIAYVLDIFYAHINFLWFIMTCDLDKAACQAIKR